MKNITIFFKSFLGLGFSGLAMLLMVVIIAINAGVALNMIVGSFYDANDRLEVLVSLENDVRDDLQYIQLNEAYYAYVQYYGYEPSDELQNIETSFTNINQTLDDLLASGYFDPEWYQPTTLELLESFRSNLNAHRGYLNDSVAAFSEGSLEDADQVFFEMSDQASYLGDDLDALIRAVEEERQNALLNIPGEIADAMMMFSISLLVVLVLGLAAYRSLAGYLDPVLRLRNAVNAIHGGHYKAEMLEKLTRKGGSVGDAARAIHGLGVHLEATNRARLQEVEKLRQALYESRRRRLRIHHGAQQDSQAKGGAR